MGGEGNWGGMVPPPEMAHLMNLEEQENWRHFDNSVNAVSFGFVATAILILMFLVTAIFERFLRPRSALPSASSTSGTDLEAQMAFTSKLHFPSDSKMKTCSKEVSVLMPGDEVPTYIAHPAPAPCPPEHVLRPLHQHNQCLNFASSSIITS